MVRREAITPLRITLLSGAAVAGGLLLSETANAQGNGNQQDEGNDSNEVVVENTTTNEIEVTVPAGNNGNGQGGRQDQGNVPPIDRGNNAVVPPPAPEDTAPPAPPAATPPGQSNSQQQTPQPAVVQRPEFTPQALDSISFAAPVTLAAAPAPAEQAAAPAAEAQPAAVQAGLATVQTANVQPAAAPEVQAAVQPVAAVPEAQAAQNAAAAAAPTTLRAAQANIPASTPAFVHPNAASPEVMPSAHTVQALPTVERSAMQTQLVGAVAEPQGQANGLTRAVGGATTAVSPAIARGLSVSRVVPESLAATPSLNVNGEGLLTASIERVETTDNPSVMDHGDDLLNDLADGAVRLFTGREPAPRQDNNGNTGTTDTQVQALQSQAPATQSPNRLATGQNVIVIGSGVNVTFGPDGSFQTSVAPNTGVTPNTPQIPLPEVTPPQTRTPDATNPPATPPEPERRTGNTSVGAMTIEYINQYESGSRNIDITQLVQAVENGVAPKAHPAGYYFMPDPGMNGNRTEYQYVRNSVHERRGNKELIAVNLALIDFFNSRTKGTNYTAQLGDMESEPHIEHDYNSPAIDMRSKSSDGSGWDGPAFVPNSPNFNPQLELEMVKFLRTLTINGQPAVAYVISGSPEVEDLVRKEGEWMVRGNGKLFYMDYYTTRRDSHNEHAHIAINSEAIAPVPNGEDPSSCAGACDKPQDEFTSHQSVANAGRPQVFGSEAPSNIHAFAPSTPEPAVEPTQPAGFTAPVPTVQPAVAVVPEPITAFTTMDVLRAPVVSAESPSSTLLTQRLGSIAAAGRLMPQLIPPPTQPGVPRTGPTDPVTPPPAETPTPPPTGENSVANATLAQVHPDFKYMHLFTEKSRNYTCNVNEAFGKAQNSFMNGGTLNADEAYGPAFEGWEVYLMWLDAFDKARPGDTSNAEVAEYMTGISYRESGFRPCSIGDFGPDNDGLVLRSAGLAAVRSYPRNGLSDEMQIIQRNIDPILNLETGVAMYIDRGNDPWTTRSLTNEAKMQAAAARAHALSLIGSRA